MSSRKARAGAGSTCHLPSGRWRARRSVGPRGQARTYSATGDTEREALALLEAKIEAAARADLDAVAEWTVGQMLDWWLREELPARLADQTIQATTVSYYERYVRLHLRPRIGRMTLATFDAPHVRRMLDDARRDGATSTLRWSMHTVLRAAFGDARRYRIYRGDNPVALVPAPRREAGRRDQFTTGHARRLLEAAHGHRLDALVHLMLSVPLRPGEPLGALWDDLDLDAGEYEVRRNLVRLHDLGVWRLHDTKGHRSRVVPLPAHAVAAVRRHRQAQAHAQLAAGPAWTVPEVVDVGGRRWRADLLLRRPLGEPVHLSTVREDLTELCAAAGVPRVTPHGLRHVAKSLLAEAGKDPVAVQQLGGWSTMAMADHYQAHARAAMREAVDRLAAAIES